MTNFALAVAGIAYVVIGVWTAMDLSDDIKDGFWWKVSFVVICAVGWPGIRSEAGFR